MDRPVRELGEAVVTLAFLALIAGFAGSLTKKSAKTMHDQYEQSQCQHQNATLQPHEFYGPNVPIVTPQFQYVSYIDVSPSSPLLLVDNLTSRRAVTKPKSPTSTPILQFPSPTATNLDPLAQISVWPTFLTLWLMILLAALFGSFIFRKLAFNRGNNTRRLEYSAVVTTYSLGPRDEPDNTDGRATVDDTSTSLEVWLNEQANIIQSKDAIIAKLEGRLQRQDTAREDRKKKHTELMEAKELLISSLQARQAELESDLAVKDQQIEERTKNYTELLETKNHLISIAQARQTELEADLPAKHEHIEERTKNHTELLETKEHRISTLQAQQTELEAALAAKDEQIAELTKEHTELLETKEHLISTLQARQAKLEADLAAKDEQNAISTQAQPQPTTDDANETWDVADAEEGTTSQAKDAASTEAQSPVQVVFHETYRHTVRGSSGQRAVVSVTKVTHSGEANANIKDDQVRRLDDESEHQSAEASEGFKVENEYRELTHSAVAPDNQNRQQPAAPPSAAGPSSAETHGHLHAGGQATTNGDPVLPPQLDDKNGGIMASRHAPAGGDTTSQGRRPCRFYLEGRCKFTPAKCRNGPHTSMGFPPLCDNFMKGMCPKSQVACQYRHPVGRDIMCGFIIDGECTRPRAVGACPYTHPS